MNRLWLIFAVLFGSINAFAQQVVLNGVIRDAESGETLIGAVVSVEPGLQAASTNAYGFYSLALSEGKHRVTFSYVGYQSHSEEIDISDSHRLNVELRRGNNTIEDVVVSAERKDDNVSNPQMGVLNFTMEEVKNVPVVFGERDLLKTIQLLPGVQSGGEGSSNFYVRGGGGDQNLILLDEATVYNASHLLGFFSTFNSDAIKDVQLYKGGIASQCGGRISSVLDIAMLDGNQKKMTTE